VRSTSSGGGSRKRRSGSRSTWLARDQSASTAASTRRGATIRPARPWRGAPMPETGEEDSIAAGVGLRGCRSVASGDAVWTLTATPCTGPPTPGPRTRA